MGKHVECKFRRCQLVASTFTRSFIHQLPWRNPDQQQCPTNQILHHRFKAQKKFAETTIRNLLSNDRYIAARVL